MGMVGEGKDIKKAESEYRTHEAWSLGGGDRTLRVEL